MTSPRNSTTAAGRSEPAPADKPETAPELIDAITQIFALFRINYHNQYYSAFNDVELLNQAKRLWLDSLRHYSVECLFKAARQVIEHSEYLPTLHKMLQACNEQEDETGLPTSQKAYREACLAPHPKARQNWSHPAVYLAGVATGWYELENQAEYLSWPVYKTHYEHYRHRALRGEPLEIPQTQALPTPGQSSLSKAERLKTLRKIRAELGL